MPRWALCKRRDFIRRLTKLGFTGPLAGTRHEFVVFRQKRLAVPSNADYTVPQVRMLLHEASAILGRDVTLEEWDSLR